LRIGRYLLLCARQGLIVRNDGDVLLILGPRLLLPWPWSGLFGVAILTSQADALEAPLQRRVVKLSIIIGLAQ
jgi:hypothetical protein